MVLMFCSSRLKPKRLKRSELNAGQRGGGGEGLPHPEAMCKGGPAPPRGGFLGLAPAAEELALETQ